MKKIYIAVIAIFMPIAVFAGDAQNITLEQKGEFESMMHIEKNDFAVPTIVDVPVSFGKNALQEVAVVDENEHVVPSMIVSNTSIKSLTLRANDSIDMGMAQNIVDGNKETYAEYPFVEGKNAQDEYIISTITDYKDESTLQVKVAKLNEQNVAIIDIESSEPFYSDGFTIYLDKYVIKPTFIRVATVDNDGNEKVIVPEKVFTSRQITFPQENAKHYRISLKYNKPLRINEIEFRQKNIKQTTNNFVRFIAQPQTSYDIYYNTPEHVKLNFGEMPNLKTDKVVVVKSVNDKKNPLYKKADTDDDGVVDSADNCVTVSNAEQTDLDNNGVGDACEDFDHDGIINTKDNCPNIANRTQQDTDVDGIGDECDDIESRFMEKYPWIPYVILAVVFVIVAGLIVKTLKTKD